MLLLVGLVLVLLRRWAVRDGCRRVSEAVAAGLY
jgi:hypothetical protein